MNRLIFAFLVVLPACTFGGDQRGGINLSPEVMVTTDEEGNYQFGVGVSAYPQSHLEVSAKREYFRRQRAAAADALDHDDVAEALQLPRTTSSAAVADEETSRMGEAIAEGFERMAEAFEVAQGRWEQQAAEAAARAEKQATDTEALTDRLEVTFSGLSSALAEQSKQLETIIKLQQEQKGFLESILEGPYGEAFAGFIGLYFLGKQARKRWGSGGGQSPQPPTPMEA